MRKVLRREDGKQSFWQWDTGQRLIVADETCCQVHFCNKTGDCALVCEVYEVDGVRFADVPNILLQTTNPITAYTYLTGEGKGKTLSSSVFQVTKRNKPDGYVYTETEVLSYAALDERIKRLETNGGGGGVYFTTDDTLSLKNGVLSVNTANDAETDNTLPITSAAVQRVVGNIEVILGTI